MTSVSQPKRRLGRLRRAEGATGGHHALASGKGP